MNDTVYTTCVTYIDARDSAGQWGWHCVGCHTEADGYDDPDDVVNAAEAHAPLAADTFIPKFDLDDWED